MVRILFGSSLMMVLAVPGIVRAQAAVETGLGAGRAAATAAPARSVGKQIGGAWGALDSAIKSGQDASSSQTVSPAPARSTRRSVPARKAAPSIPPAPAVAYADPSLISAGLAYDDLVKRFGPPSMEITLGPDKRMLQYVAKTGTAQLEVEDGKVKTVTTSKSEPPAAPSK
jgi:hypothetical protein